MIGTVRAPALRRLRGIGAFVGLVAWPEVAKSQETWPAPQRLALGAFAGAIALAPDHDLVDASYEKYAFKAMSPEVGIRSSYFFQPRVGAEAELAGGATRTRDPASHWAAFGALRTHAILSLPVEGESFKPFVLAGAGVLAVATGVMGHDVDPAIHGGVGTFYRATRSWLLRAELRATASPGAADHGVPAVHGEVLFGGSYEASAPATTSTPRP